MRRHAISSATLLGGAAYAVAIGFLATTSPRVAVLLTLLGVVAVALTWRTVAIAVIAVPAVFVVQRAPGIDVSLVDVIVAMAGAAALLAGAHRSLSPNARIVLGSFAAYLGLLLGSVAFNHSVRSDFEWFHRLSLVAGSILVGAWLVREGLEHVALRALLGLTSLLGVAAVLTSAAQGFAPAYPLWFHKNFVGSVCATVLLVMVAAPSAFRVRPGLLRLGYACVIGGLLSSQSRGAIIALCAGLFLWFFRSDRERRRRVGALAVLALIGFTVFVGVSVRDQLALQKVNEHDSISQRVEVETATRELWQQHPLSGVGLRFFATPAFAGYEPPNNVLNEVLAEAGVPGFVGFVIFVAGSLVGLSRRRDRLALAALCVVGSRFLHGLLDIYWVAGTTTLPWLIAGMGLGAPAPPAETGAVQRQHTARL